MANVKDTSRDTESTPQPSESDSGVEDSAAATAPPVPNTLETTLAMFPLAETHESRETGKRHRQQQAQASIMVTLNDRKINEALHDVLFPAEDDLLGDSLDRVRVDPDSVLKKRRSETGRAVSILNRRVMAMLQHTSILKPPAPKLPTALQAPRVNRMRALPSMVPAPPKDVRLSSSGTGGGNCQKRLELSMVKIVPKAVSYMAPNEFGVRMVTPYKLFEYQSKAVQWMIDREEGKVRNDLYAPNINGCMLAMVMGLGKTTTAATLVARTLQKQRSDGSCSIYVCPKNLLGTVRHEFEKFFGDQIRLIIYHKSFLGSEYNSFGAKQIREYDIIITNYSSITTRMSAYMGGTGKKKNPNPRPMAPGAREFCEFEWFRIILDESHEIRERNTARFKTVAAMKSPRRICLTGTPIHNKIKDLYTQMEFCGLRLPRGAKPTRENLYALKITDMIRFVDNKDAESVKLPPKRVHKIYFDLSEEEKVMHRFYMAMARDILTQSMKDTGKAKGQRTFEALAGTIRVLQVCSAPYLVTDASKDTSVPVEDDMCDVAPAVIFPADTNINRWLYDRNGTAGVQSSKMRRFVELVDSLRKQQKTPLKVVVFANMTSTLRVAIGAMVKRWPDYESRSVFVHGGILSTHKREEMFTRFRIDPAVEILFMTLKIGCFGLNLTEADKVIFLEPWYSYSSLSQAESRVHRIGQVRDVDIFYLLAKDSAEERVYRIAQNKKTMAEDVKAGTVMPERKQLGSDEMRYILMDAETTQ